MLNWMHVAWLAITCTAVILGCFHLLVWTRQRDQVQHAILAAISFVVAFCAVVELQAFSASTIAAYAEALRWGHTFASLVIVLMVAYVQFTVPGRWWLGLTVCVGRIATEIANRTTGASVSFLSIDELRAIPTWGEVSFMSPVGQANPWYALAQLCNLLLLVYLVDAGLALARQPPSERRRRNLQSIVAFLFLVVFTAVEMLLLVALEAPFPATLSLSFLGIALVMNHHLAGDLLRAAELARALRISESNLQGMARWLALAEQSAGLGQWSWDANRQQVSLSERGAQIFGRAHGGDVDVDELLAQVVPSDRLRVRDFVSELQRGVRQDFSGQLRIHMNDGAERLIAAHGMLSLDGKKASASAHGVIIDLTHQRSIEEILGLVFAASPISMLLIDPHGLIALSNAAASELSGYPPGELLGMPVETLVPPAARGAHPLRLADFAASPARRPMSPSREVHLHTRDGTDVVVEVALNPVAVDGKAMVIAIIHDISARLQRERELAMQRAALAHVARVGMLAELSGSLAHEINQPLAAILSNAQASRRFIGHTPPNLDEVRDGLTEIVDSAKRAGEVIRRLRAMLRNEPPNFTVLDINQTIHEVMQILHSDLIDRHVRIVESFADHLPPVLGDRVQLQQVLLNLIVNAADAMAKTDRVRRITVTTGQSADGVLIEVADVGSGIAEEDFDRIFQTFISTKPDGLGFGLPLCLTLVQAHGGKLWATNNEGAGATFHVLLPANG